MDASDKLDINAICLRNAVLCADCEVISDSAHETCRVCGSHSLLSLSRVLGTLPVRRAQIIESKPERSTFLLEFRVPHKRARHTVA
jgi:anaerobic ribonucleoside-triphosphate reductase